MSQTIFNDHGGHNFEEVQTEVGGVMQCTNCGITGKAVTLSMVEVEDGYTQEQIDICGA